MDGGSEVPFPGAGEGLEVFRQEAPDFIGVGCAESAIMERRGGACLGFGARVTGMDRFTFETGEIRMGVGGIELCGNC